IWLMEICDLIISDSGGIQEEAPTFGKHVLVTRNFSERMEGINSGFSSLVGTNKSIIISRTLEILHNPQHDNLEPNPYGDGKAAEKIVNFLMKLKFKN